MNSEPRTCQGCHEERELYDCIGCEQSICWACSSRVEGGERVCDECFARMAREGA